MNHSTPINSPSSVKMKPSTPSVSPIRWSEETENNDVPMESPVSDAKRKVPLSPSQYIEYMDEWVMNLSNVTNYLEYVEAKSYINDVSSDSDHSSSFDDWISFSDTCRTASRIHSVDVTFLQRWLKNNSFADSIYGTPDPDEQPTVLGDSAFFVTVAENQPSQQQQHSDFLLQELLGAASPFKQAVNQGAVSTAPIVPQIFGRSQEEPIKKEPGWLMYERMIKSAPRPQKKSKLSLLRKLITKK